MTLGKAIAVARAKKGLSLRELSRLTGIQNSHLSEMETGKRWNLEWITVVRIAKVLKLNLNQLVAQHKDGDKT